MEALFVRLQFYCVIAGAFDLVLVVILVCMAAPTLEPTKAPMIWFAQCTVTPRILPHGNVVPQLMHDLECSLVVVL